MPTRHVTPAVTSSPDYNLTRAWDTAVQDPSVLVADGFGVSITVRSGHLVIHDGIAGDRRVRRIPRQPRTVSRLVVLATGGILSLEATRWLADAAIAWAQLGSDGQIIATSGPRRTDARLLRAQAAGSTSDAGLEVTRALLIAKLEGQAANLRDVIRAHATARMISEYADELRKCDDLDGMRAWEANAAAVYWQALADRVTVPFAQRDLADVPAHWRTFAGRTSLAHDQYARNNHATDPVNACLNYLYRLAEIEAIHACHELGLHPALGILHADRPGRDSMAFDLIEAIRPRCDRLILGMLDCGLGVPHDHNGRPAYIQRRWLTETRDGRCRLVPPLTHRVASWSAQVGAQLRSHAEAAAQVLAASASRDIRFPRATYPKGTASRVPVSSKRPARLRDNVSQADLLPDHLWETVRPLIPEAPAGPRRPRKQPAHAAADRTVLTALAAHELLAVPWSNVRVTASPQTCRARLLAWQWATVGGISAWDRISEQFQASGHLSSLLASPPDPDTGEDAEQA